MKIRSVFDVSALRPLRYADFRVLGVVGMLGGGGMMGGQVALGWFVLQLTDSALMVALVIALRMLPNLFLGIPAGVVADIVDRRRIVQVSNMLMALR